MRLAPKRCIILEAKHKKMPNEKKLFNSKRPQLRRCAFCDKVGHNKSTCADFRNSLTEVKPSTTPVAAPIRLFIHHVSNSPNTSEHVVNLKQSPDQAWHKVAAIEPTKNKSYDFSAAYEKMKQTVKADVKPVSISAPIIQVPVAQKISRPKIQFKKTFNNPLKNPLAKLSENFSSFKNNTHSFFRENFVWQKMAAATAVLFVILVIPGTAQSYFADVKLTKDKIAGDSTVGFMSLQNSTAALMQANIPAAQDAITNALNSFGSAVETMDNNHQILQKIASVIPVLGDEVKGRQALLLAGQKIALGNTYLLKGLSESQADASSTLDNRLDIIMTHLNSAIPNYEEAMKNLDSVNSDSLPLNYQGPFIEFKKIFSAVLSDLKNLYGLGGTIKEVFGIKGQRRYLLVFQNPDELRPTGGFLGSIAVMDIKDGKILNLDVPAGGSYDLQGQLDEYLIPPTPLLLTNKRWEFQDANWFPDFSASAQKIMWFYRHSRNVTVDGVIAINSSVLERLLAITGPITDDKRNLTLSADNALTTIQKVVETGPEKEIQKPKQILSDLAPQIIAHFQNSQPKDLLPLLVSVQDALSKKEIQAYFSDNDAQSSIEQMGWSGKISNTNQNQDYLGVFNANIHGQKSDARIKQTISHQATVQDDGSIIDTVTISRTHTGSADEEFYGAPNIDFIRVYVPQGSELVSANGFVWPQENDFNVPESFYKNDDFLNETEKEIKIDERTGTRITQEFGKTSFGNWTITSPGQTSQIEFTYKLPFKISDITSSSDTSWNQFLGSKEAVRYQLVVQKQSGINSSFESQIIFPDVWKPNYKEGDGLELAKNGGSISALTLDTDRVWGLVMEK